ncbi:MAG: DUF6314 family protein [Verrucomicrobiota bacterium]
MNKSDSLSEKVFFFFQGEWQIRRRFAGSYEGRLIGNAIFTIDTSLENTYAYEESGRLETVEGQQFGSKQKYRYCLSGPAIEVLKLENGDWEPMHELNFVEEGAHIIASHRHLCGEDRYSVVYRIDLTGSFQMSYKVVGPQKDYLIETQFARS